jgi:hypothetical protein
MWIVDKASQKLLTGWFDNSDDDLIQFFERHKLTPDAVTGMNRGYILAMLEDGSAGVVHADGDVTMNQLEVLLGIQKSLLLVCFH